MKSVGVLAGAFNPVTRAHMALIDAGLNVVDEAVCVMPRAYPHKSFEGASLEDRIAMLRRAGSRYTIEITQGGLFIDIARELRRTRADAEIFFLCGRDAAERVLTWHYGESCAVERMLGEFGLLVAARRGEFIVPERLDACAPGRLRNLPLVGSYDDLSSTEIRRRIAVGEPWEHLVPEPIVDMVRRIYTRPFQTRGS